MRTNEKGIKEQRSSCEDALTKHKPKFLYAHADQLPCWACWSRAHPLIPSRDPSFPISPKLDCFPVGLVDLSENVPNSLDHFRISVAPLSKQGLLPGLTGLETGKINVSDSFRILRAPPRA